MTKQEITDGLQLERQSNGNALAEDTNIYIYIHINIYICMYVCTNVKMCIKNQDIYFSKSYIFSVSFKTSKTQ